MGGAKTPPKFFKIMDLTKILKVGDKAYSPLLGDCTIININVVALHSIKVKCSNGDYSTFTKDGRFYSFSPECLLFPSKDNRDWSTWEAKNKCLFKPFDKVLVRDDPGYDQDHWCCDFFSHVDDNDCFVTSGGEWSECIPYNKETQHLVGTNQDCPDKYKIW